MSNFITIVSNTILAATEVHEGFNYPNRITDKKYRVIREDHGKPIIAIEPNDFTNLYRTTRHGCPYLLFESCDCSYHTYIDIGINSSDSLYVEIITITCEEKLTYFSTLKVNMRISYKSYNDMMTTEKKIMDAVTDFIKMSDTKQIIDEHYIYDATGKN
jgi:hypothetical protein